MSDAAASISFLEIAQRISSLGREYDTIAETQSKLPEGTERHCAAHAKLVMLMDEQTALQDLALAMQARTLTDAAVQLAVVFEALTEVFVPPLDRQQQLVDLASDLERFERALAGITLVVADTAGLDLDKICQPTLLARLNRHLEPMNVPPQPASPSLRSGARLRATVPPEGPGRRSPKE